MHAVQPIDPSRPETAPAEAGVMAELAALVGAHQRPVWRYLWLLARDRCVDIYQLDVVQ